MDPLATTQPNDATANLQCIATKFSSVMAHIGSFLSLHELLSLEAASKETMVLISSNRVLWMTHYNRAFNAGGGDGISPQLRAACLLEHA